VTAPLLRLKQAALIRGGRLLFRNLDLSLGPGDALHIAGPNGAGKSSLIRLAAGLLEPASGTVTRADLALCDEKPALDPELPLGRALSFWSRLGNPRGDDRPALGLMGIGHLSDVPVRLLSTGQLKRAALARVAASPAPLWLLDEPLNGLDSDGVSRLSRLIRSHLNNGGAVLAASHQDLPGAWSRMELGA
jgi:heme exporter protein A